jgi:preprotein translocase subunit SecY
MLLIFRVVATVPVPGIDPTAISQALSSNGGSLNQVFGLLDIFSGGSLAKNFSVLALGLYPYITASIVVQLLQPIIPKLEALAREGEAGQNRIAQIQRYLTVPLALLQAFGQMALLVSIGAIPNTQFNLFDGNAFLPTVTTLATLTAGTLFMVWLGELITENGIGNGISILIFANIMVSVPQLIGSALVSSSSTGGGLSSGALVSILLYGGLGLAMIFSMVCVYQAQRRVPVQYPTKRRSFGGIHSGQQSTYIPLQVNSAGMIPIIFAQSILLLPTVLSNFLTFSSHKNIANIFNSVRQVLDPSQTIYWVLFGILVALFTFFYATVIWEQQKMAENLQKQGAYIPGIRPGPSTDLYLKKILYRVTLGGAVFLGVVAIIPAFFNSNTTISSSLSAASLLIVVGVVMDTMKQIEAQMVMRNYSGFLT